MTAGTTAAECTIACPGCVTAPHLLVAIHAVGHVYLCVCVCVCCCCLQCVPVFNFRRVDLLMRKYDNLQVGVCGGGWRRGD